MHNPSDRLRWARERARFSTATQAARAFDWTISTYLGHENGDRNPSREAAKRYAKAFKVRWEWLLEGQGPPTEPPLGPVAVVGFVGAGGSIHYHSGGGDQELDEAPRPPDASPNTVALVVKGDSMPGVAEDRWMVYYDDRREVVTDDLVGELCVVQVEGDGVFVKRLLHGRDPGTFDLISTGHDPIRGVSIDWAAKVTWIKPR